MRLRLLLAAVFLLASITESPARLFVTALGFSYTAPATRKFTATPEPSETPAPSPTATPTPDPEQEKANRDKILAETNKAKAEADKAAADARKSQAEAEQATLATKIAIEKAKLGIGVASPTATPPAGNITGDKDKFIETQLLAEMSARKASQQLVQSVCGSKNPMLTSHPIHIVVINSSTDKAAAENYSAILAQLQFLHERYGQLIGQAEDAQNPEEGPKVRVTPGLLVPAATEAVKSVADLINMFRTETEFKDQAVSVDTRMVVTLLVNTLLTTDQGPCEVKEIYYPSLYPLSISANAANGLIIQAYRNLLDDITRADLTVAANNKMVTELGKKAEALDARIAELKKKIEKQEKADGQKKKATKGGKGSQPPPFDVLAAGKEISKADADKNAFNFKIDRLKKTVASLEAFKASIVDLLKLLTAVDSPNNTTVLAGLLRAERLKDILKNENAYVMDLAVKASGTNRIRKNAFFNAKIAHSGGVSIGADLFNNRDQLVFGQLEEYYIEFTSSGEIRKRVGFQKLDSSFAK